MKRIVLSLVLINAGVFIGVAALLPRAPSYHFSGPLSQIINARLHWEVAWLLTLASVFITSGVVMVLSKSKG